MQAGRVMLLDDVMMARPRALTAAGLGCHVELALFSVGFEGQDALTHSIAGTGANALRGYFLFRSPRRDPHDMDRVADHICGTLFALTASGHPETRSIHS